MNKDTYWYSAKENAVHESVFATITLITKNDGGRIDNFVKYARLYGNMGLGVADLGTSGGMTSNPGPQNRVTLNVVKSVIDTATSKITKNRPRPQFLTSGGDYSEQQKAKKLSKFIEGQFSYTKAYEAGALVFRDAAIFGFGALKVYIKEGQDGKEELAVERVLPTEIFVERLDSMYGCPTSLHQVKSINKDVLKSRYPDKAHFIDRAELKINSGVQLADKHNFCTVVESWHLPTRPGAKDGRHTIALSSTTLVDSKYDDNFFPFAFLKYSKPVTGFFGTGVAENLIGVQIEINKTLRTIQMATHLTAVPKVFIKNGTKVPTQHINNEIGSIIRYEGEKPSFESVGAVPPELYRWVGELYNRAFEIEGISQLSATSKKPSGLDAAVALREFNDIETERFYNVGQEYEAFYLSLADIMIKLMRKLQSNPSVKIPGSRFVETIKWSEVNMSEDKYTLTSYPVSFLPSTPAGKLAAVQELMQSGLISTARGAALLDFPDLEASSMYQNSPIDLIEMIIEAILSKGQFIAPEPYMGTNALAIGLETMTQAYLHSQTQNVSEEKLDLMRNWIDAASALMAPPPAPPPPQAVAEAAPVSELLPNAPQ